MIRQTANTAPHPDSQSRISGPAAQEKTGQDWEKLDEEFFLLSYVIGAPIAVWLSYWLPGSEFILRWVTTLGAALWLVVVVARVVGARLNSGCLESGRVARHETARALGELRSAGYRVVQNVVAGDHNIEHLLTGPAGVFIVATATGSGQAEQGTKLHLARLDATFVAHFATSVIGKRVDVRPILASPGVSEECAGQRENEFILDPARLGAVVRELPTLLTPDEIERLGDCLEHLAVVVPVDAARTHETGHLAAVKVYPFRAAMTH